MKEFEPKEVIENRAEVSSAEQISCNQCSESVVFLLQDKNHQFSMGLTTVLECLEYAITQRNLPQLPRSWCAKVEEIYDIGFDEGISYHDFKKLRGNSRLFNSRDESARNSVGLSKMHYRLEKASRTCLGDFQLRGLIGKLLY